MTDIRRPNTIVALHTYSKYKYTHINRCMITIDIKQMMPTFYSGPYAASDRPIHLAADVEGGSGGSTGSIYTVDLVNGDGYQRICHI